jgi:GH43 family beta-xylosidase
VTLPVVAATAMALSGLAAPAAQAAEPAANHQADHTASATNDPTPIADYRFDDHLGTQVPNAADGPGAAGKASVENATDADFSDTALHLTGGAKDGEGTWVRLPDDLLKNRTSATVTTEVKVDASMRNDFNFLWNIGGENTEKYFFATAKDAPRSAITVGSNGAEKSATSSSNLSAGHWTSVTSVLDGEAGTLTFYVDGKKAGATKTDLTPADITDQSMNTIGRSPWPDALFKGDVSAFRAYPTALSADQVQQENLDDAKINEDALAEEAQATLKDLTVPSGEITSDHVSLPTAGGAVSWTSSDPDVIGTDGTVSQPARGHKPVPVTLTAEASVRGVTAERRVSVTVAPSSATPRQQLEAAAKNYVVAPSIGSGEKLPSAPDGLILRSLKVKGALLRGHSLVNPTERAVRARVTATLARSAAPRRTTHRRFTVTVLPKSAQRLAAYHRTPTSEQEANNADVALSMHLATQAAGRKTWTPLNENYGIFFPKVAKPVPSDGPDLSLTRSLKDPTLFRLKDGGYGIVATRVARGGGADGTEENSILVATSKDLLSYTELGQISLDESAGVHSPTAIYDTSDGKYRISWTTDSGAQRHQDISDLAAAVKTKPTTSSAAGRATGTDTADDLDIDDFGTGNTLAVDAKTATALQTRFGRIKNTGSEPLSPKRVATGSELGSEDLPSKVTLDYSDGSKGSLPVDSWDLSGVHTDKPGTYTATAKLKKTEYPKPFSTERADPSAYKFDFNGTTKYLMIATNDPDLDNVSQKGKAFMPMRMADTLSGLSDKANPKEVHLLERGDKDASGKTMTGCFWAPEFHEIDGRLSILFMPCYGSNPDYKSGRASIMQLRQDAAGKDLDPTVAANWTTPRAITRADGTDLNDVSGISLDMTYFQDESGQSYYVWQQRCSTYIAKMNPKNPGQVTSDPVRIISPEYAWDNSCAEGPNVHERDGKLYLIYSGSGVGNTYTTGLATAAASGAGLTDPSSWNKLNYPLQKSEKFEGEWMLGTGHGMWTEDEDGQLIYVFHARTDAGGTGRDMFVRRVHFASDGMPIMDMESSEELASPTITMKIVVADDAD